LRGEGKLKRELQLSVFLVSNELLEVDLRLDSRVQSAMSGEEVFFPPYGVEELRTVMQPRLERAFREGALPEEVREYGVELAADRWGDARKTLRLFRRAGETANDRGLRQVTRECVDTSIEASEREAIIEKITQLPRSHIYVLVAVTGWVDTETGGIIQPVTTEEIATMLQREMVPERFQLGTRAIRNVLTDLETMGLVETWVDSRGSEGRVKQVETTFDPQIVREAQAKTAATVGQLSDADGAGE
jgi:cell division control protein 6